MIELTQIKSTDKLGQLQGILNTAFSEIQTDQPFVGVCQNISINIYSDTTIVGSVMPADLSDQRLYAICFPESNGVFISKVFGFLTFTFNGTESDAYNKIVIHVPSVKLATHDAVMSTFVSPSRLGLVAENNHVMPNGNGTIHEVGATPTNTMYTKLLQHDNVCDVTLSNIASGRVVTLAPNGSYEISI